MKAKEANMPSANTIEYRRKKGCPRQQARSASASDVSLGRVLRSARLTRGFTQRTLANHIGITFQQLQKYERGVNRVSWARLIEISGVLDISIGQFLVASNSLQGIEDNSAFDEAFSESCRLLESFLLIRSSEGRRTAIELVEAIARRSRTDA